MSTTTVENRVQNLGPDELSCPDCGQRVWHAEQTLAMLTIARERFTHAGARVVADVQIEHQFARCRDCENRAARAESVANLFPALRQRLGSRSFAVDRFRAVLQALDVLAVSPKVAQRLLGSERLVQVMLDELVPAARPTSWSANFVPVWSAASDPATCAAKPWAAVDAGLLQRLRDAFARVLNAEQDRLTDFQCPSHEGCMLCGVGSLRAMRSQGVKGGLWHGEYHAQPGTLGGKRTPELVRGFLCNVCAKATDEVGALGERALEAAVFRHLGIELSPLAEPEVSGLIAWVALPRGTKPNERPWEHIDGLESAAESLKSA